MLRPGLVTWMVSVGWMVLGGNVIYGQEYPNKPIRMITSAVGGGSDFVARLIAPRISGSLDQPVIVENRASGFNAAEFVSKAPPDGYNLLVTGGSLWISPLQQKVPYDAVRDYAPITLIDRAVLLVAVHPSVPVRSIKELIALAKARPGELNYGAGDTSSPSYLASELFKSMAGINIVHVPYKGQAAAITGLVSGEVQLTIYDVGLIAPHVKLGKLRALAVTSAQPSALFPGLPTMAASGLPGFEAGGITGIWAPAKTPAAIINRLNHEIVRVLNLPEVKERFINTGREAVGSSPDEFAALIKADIARISKVIKDAGIKGQ